MAGGSGVDSAVTDGELLAQIRRLAADARRVTSVCSGAFLLAAAGLLSGRRATTHWADCRLLGDTYADVTVTSDAIYVHDGNVWTSAGVTAGIDLALALVAAAAFAVYVVRPAWPYLALGVVAVTLVVPEALLDWTDNDLGPAGAMLVTGMTLLAASLLGFRLRRDVGSGA